MNNKLLSALIWTLASLSPTSQALALDLSDVLLNESAVAETSEEAATFLFEVVGDDECGGPCPKLEFSAAVGLMNYVSIGFRPTPSFVIDAGAHFTYFKGHHRNIYAHNAVNKPRMTLEGYTISSRIRLMEGLVELGGRYMPFRAEKMSEEFNSKMRKFGYEARINLYYEVDGPKVYIAVSGLRKDWSPNLLQVGVTVPIITE